MKIVLCVGLVYFNMCWWTWIRKWEGEREIFNGFDENI